MVTRRQFLRRASLASAALALPIPASERVGMPPRPTHAAHALARNEDYWEQIAAQYDVTDQITNLEAGYWGIMAAPVLEAFKHNTDRVNRENSFYARTQFGRDAREIRERVAATLGIKPGEVVFSRNATEALQALIGQYNRLEPGETVMYADLDYPSMKQAMDGLANRRGATVATLVIPEPAESIPQIVAAYAEALDAHPKTRLLLLTHANNQTGLIHPVREITAMARARGVDVVVDAAHSWGQVPLDIDDFGADYVGLNLHKWIGAPIGVGAMIIRERGLSGIDRAHGDPGSLESIDSRLHTGTMNFAVILTVTDALDFQESIGWENKYARVRYLRDLWAEKARAIDGVDILTPDHETLTGAITSFRLTGRVSNEANRAIARTLLDDFGIFTVVRNDPAGGSCIRVTPTLYNLPPDVEKLVDALRELAA
jgi:selenocysteine lyase/cysteine desulfurase